ncbi:MAG: hypothetical protein WC119_00115 [Synergistaceae bacterium]
MTEENKSNFTLGTDEEMEVVTPEAQVISEVKSYTDNEGRSITGLYPLDGSVATFIGGFVVQSNMGPIRMRIDFPEGLKLEECFDQFDFLAQETMQKAQEEAENRSRIITPDQARKSGIIVP